MSKYSPFQLIRINLLTTVLSNITDFSLWGIGTSLNVSCRSVFQASYPISCQLTQEPIWVVRKIFGTCLFVSCPIEFKTFVSYHQTSPWPSSVDPAARRDTWLYPQYWPKGRTWMKSRGWEDNRRALLQYILTCEEWARTSAYKGAIGSRSQSIYELTVPTQSMMWMMSRDVCRLTTTSGSTSPTLFEQWCGFFYLPQEPDKCKCCEKGPTVLESLTVGRCHYKGSTFFSVI